MSAYIIYFHGARRNISSLFFGEALLVSTIICFHGEMRKNIIQQALSTAMVETLALVMLNKLRCHIYF